MPFYINLAIRSLSSLEMTSQIIIIRINIIVYDNYHNTLFQDIILSLPALSLSKYRRMVIDNYDTLRQAQRDIRFHLHLDSYRDQLHNRFETQSFTNFMLRIL